MQTVPANEVAAQAEIDRTVREARAAGRRLNRARRTLADLVEARHAREAETATDPSDILRVLQFQSTLTGDGDSTALYRRMVSDAHQVGWDTDVREWSVSRFPFRNAERVAVYNLAVKLRECEDENTLTGRADAIGAFFTRWGLGNPMMRVFLSGYWVSREFGWDLIVAPGCQDASVGLVTYGHRKAERTTMFTGTIRECLSWFVNCDEAKGDDPDAPD